MARTQAVLASMSDESRLLDVVERRDYLWRNVSRLAAAAVEDARALGLRGAFLEQATIYVDDPSYRQGAASIVLELRADTEDPFTVGFTCVVDHGYVSLRVTHPPQTAKFEALRNRIESAAGGGYETLLRQLR